VGDAWPLLVLAAVAFVFARLMVFLPATVWRWRHAGELNAPARIGEARASRSDFSSRQRKRSTATGNWISRRSAVPSTLRGTKYGIKIPRSGSNQRAAALRLFWSK
jgi:hypothetical protein